MSAMQRRTEVVLYWWEKGKESLLSAERELQANALGYAMNRVYYAAFYIVSAALLEREFSFKKHTGVRAAFHREFIKSGVLETQWGKFYDQLFEDRQEADYVALVEFDLEYVKNQLSRCREFHSVVRPLIRSLNQKQ